MDNTTKSVINQALELSSQERAIIAEQLLSSLDHPDSEMDKIWAKEAETRLDALKQGKIQKVPAESVLGTGKR
ncbi:Uncharacterised protein [Zhongshania aliphaticivorans]|uniref:Addiction module protein n=1 Tax=Zhongshania aliphaticivorans TaxID=1470434 RepID=A0A5S9N9S2_9GAMM|nr:addiction module protein [Zhongshania aliphaticivorans]CAA0079476.1 Uncharacterised protein [Zhongshania aliphaticivorans]CAA0086180.1 Uncharacterised protein [Zhongshania aliphaticivorans]